jgi:chromate reductase
MQNETIKILGISGSLKTTSSNTAILRAIQKLSPPDVQLHIYDGLDDLPHFSPERDGEKSAASVIKLRKLVSEANGIIISTPEYAFNLPGVLKNALDWLVSSGELNEKPVTAISVSPGFTAGEKALASLLMTLTALGVTDGGKLSIGNINKKLNENKELTDPETARLLTSTLEGLLLVIKNKININING